MILQKEMNKESLINEVVSAIKSAQKIAVVSHYNPDADAHGSSCALALCLIELKKEVFLVNQSALTDRYAFIPGTKLVNQNWPEAALDLVVITDCGTLERVGEELQKKVVKTSNMVNIDHHISNDNFAKLNFVDVSASSSSEIIYHVIKALGVGLTSDIATALYAGICGDTGSFRFSCTTEETFRIAAELVNAGASPDRISTELFGNSSLAAVLLQAEAIRKVNMHTDGKIAEIIVTDEMYSLFNAVPDDTEALAERARDIKGVYVAVLIKKDKDIWRISMRSIDKRYNVSDIAANFGGGGHSVAAAFRWRRGLEELRSQLIPKIKSVVESV